MTDANDSQRTASALDAGSLDDLLRQNVETIHRIEQSFDSARTGFDVLADRFASIFGSPVFLYYQAAALAAWIGLNLSLPGPSRFDAPPFSLLALCLGVESICLSTFILISQRRQQKLVEQRNRLELQINLLAEQENSQMILMLKLIMERLNIRGESLHSVPLEEETDHELLAKELERVASEPVEENEAEDADSV